MIDLRSVNYFLKLVACKWTNSVNEYRISALKEFNLIDRLKLKIWQAGEHSEFNSDLLELWPIGTSPERAWFWLRTFENMIENRFGNMISNRLLQNAIMTSLVRMIDFERILSMTINPIRAA